MRERRDKDGEIWAKREKKEIKRKDKTMIHKERGKSQRDKNERERKEREENE